MKGVYQLVARQIFPVELPNNADNSGLVIDSELPQIVSRDDGISNRLVFWVRGLKSGVLIFCQYSTLISRRE